MKRYHWDFLEEMHVEAENGTWVSFDEALADKAADAAMHVQVADALRARIAALEAELAETRGKLGYTEAMRDIMIGRADRVSLFLTAYAELVAAGMSVMVPDDQIPESGLFNVLAKARHCREFNAAMRRALDADKRENDEALSDVRERQKERIAVLEAEVIVLQRQAEIDKANEMRAMRQREDARAQVARLEADAGRYRFLRVPNNAIVYAKDRNAWGDGASGHVRYDTPEQLDAAITAAMGKEKQT